MANKLEIVLTISSQSLEEQLELDLPLFVELTQAIIVSEFFSKIYGLLDPSYVALHTGQITLKYF